MEASLKLEIYQKSCAFIENKVRIAREAVKNAQDAANGEERSTAGDKYDTSRAMSHIDQGMYSKQLSEVLSVQKVLTQVEVSKFYEKIASGALVQTTAGYYLIAASVGMMEGKGVKVAVISAVAPISQVLLGKKEGDVVDFNGRKITVERVW